MPSIFTQIMNGDMPGHIVWSDDVCMAFLTIAPLKPGHTLVVPRAEIDSWTDLEPEVMQHLSGVAHSIIPSSKYRICTSWWRSEPFSTKSASFL